MVARKAELMCLTILTGDKFGFLATAIRLEFGLAIASFNFDENFNGMRLIYGSNKRF